MECNEEAGRRRRVCVSDRKEPADVLLVLRAALAFNPAAADPVVAFVSETGLQDVRVQNLLERLGDTDAAA